MATIAENLLTLNEAKKAIKTAIEEKGQDLTGVPFTKYAEKIAAISGGGVEMTSGSFTVSRLNTFVSIEHGLSSPPKLVVCFHNDYENTQPGKVAGFVYTEKIATLYCSDDEGIISAGAITTPNNSPGYGAIYVDETYFSVDEPEQQWESTDYEWEAYTW